MRTPRDGTGGRKAVFVDRDGVLNEMVYDETHGILDSPRRPEQVRMVPGAGAFLKSVRELGFFISVVTNQPGIAKGTLTMEDLDMVNKTLADQLAEEGGRWDELRFCPHHPDGGTNPNSEFVGPCDCRKPKPGMLLAAAKEHGMDLASSWMIGDGLNDMEAGRAAGCRPILVVNLKIEHVRRFFSVEDYELDAIAADLDEALRIISG